MKFRKGDVVSVNGTVRHDCEDDETTVFVDFPGGYQAVTVDAANAQMREPFLVVGDDVWWGLPDQVKVGTVLAKANGHLWLDLGGGEYCTRMVGTVGRVDPKKEDADAS